MMCLQDLLAHYEEVVNAVLGTTTVAQTRVHYSFRE